MKEEKVSIALEVAKFALNPTGYLIGQIVNSTTKAVEKSEEVTDRGELQAIRLEAERQEFSLKMAESQARVAQEIAIARRIETAGEVEIEEFYDYSGEGHAGLKTDGNALGIGFSGSGKRVSRRVYRFKGISKKSVLT
ncbi:hypothetical protein FGF66_11040 [Chlorobaculum thiosulfatiphilum]|uniref:Uncharacterized protein n=1 Tax=Chlorobaculum thiosulfatiphilum TaxID=115852 RepID=A0A5C4S0U6_CHLTI|nr:hypothetical protein [Chlorobaculum thiosulfatiphilum]TNJ37133.1 hypothetical protein FGF66_11040 [Chlorobaculum thiosulfatiphilum]